MTEVGASKQGKNAPPTGTRSQDAASRVVREITEMIVNGELLPGQQIGQERMSQLMNVSRLPLREAMKQLAAEGLVHHTYNSGYAVTRLDRSGFDQIYLLRSLLETAVLKNVHKPDEEQFRRLTEACEAMEEFDRQGDQVRMREHNREFHFLIFESSGMELLTAELARVWTLTAPYHALYYTNDDARERVKAEHREMLEAAGAGDGERLAKLMEVHRQGGEWRMNHLLKQ